MGGANPNLPTKKTSLNCGVKEFQWTKPIALAEKLENKRVMDIIKVPQLDRNLGADGGVRKYFPD